MAKAFATERQEEEVVLKTVKGFSLEINEDEAQVLVDILMRVGGPTKGRRGYAKSILEALSEIGIKPSTNRDFDNDGSYSNSIYFK